MNENKISIKRYDQAADPRVSLGGIKWEKKWDVCVQCDSREEAEALRTALAQPEPAECDGGQCGIGGYCKECPKPLIKLKEMLEVQGGDPRVEIGRECLALADSIRDGLDEDGEKQQALGAAWVGLAIERHFMIDSDGRK
jgi:hypothetical protein